MFEHARALLGARNNFSNSSSQSEHARAKSLDKTKKSKFPFTKEYKDKVILKDLSGVFKARETTAIMGASGAGKTTLLNILTCNLKCDKNGKIFANNL